MSTPSSGSAVSRRLRTIPALLIATLLVATTAPLCAVLALAIGVVRRRRFALLRAWVFVVVYLTAECIGLLVLTGAWLRHAMRRDLPRFQARVYAIQTAWVRSLWRAATFTFKLQWRVTGLETATPGPVIVLVRHTSVVDTVIPTTYLTGEANVRLRFVLKRELLGDPCLDVAGHWVPNVFIDRHADDSAAALAAIETLARGMAPDEGVLIYPEGTLFSRRKLARSLERLAKEHPHRYERARALANTLPPRPGGALALLRGAPQADIVLCAHEGLGGVGKVREILSGSLIGKAVHVQFRRFARSTIPTEGGAQAEWLLDRWLEVDRWVGALRQGQSA